MAMASEAKEKIMEKIFELFPTYLRELRMDDCASDYDKKRLEKPEAFVQLLSTIDTLDSLEKIHSCLIDHLRLLNMIACAEQIPTKIATASLDSLSSVQSFKKLMFTTAIEGNFPTVPSDIDGFVEQIGSTRFELPNLDRLPQKDVSVAGEDVDFPAVPEDIDTYNAEVGSTRFELPNLDRLPQKDVSVAGEDVDYPAVPENIDT